MRWSNERPTSIPTRSLWNGSHCVLGRRPTVLRRAGGDDALFGEMIKRLAYDMAQLINDDVKVK